MTDDPDHQRGPAFVIPPPKFEIKQNPKSGQMEVEMRGTMPAPPASMRFHPVMGQAITVRFLVWVGDAFGEPSFTDALRIEPLALQQNLSAAWLAQMDLVARCLWEKIAPSLEEGERREQSS